jgi:protein-S-isoprenylcysteine O-methyltransferase Ste14
MSPAKKLRIEVFRGLVMADEEQIGRGTLGKTILSVGCMFLLLAAVMFLPAGIGWWNGWIFLAVFAVQMAVGSLYLWQRNPAIFVARSKIHKGTKSWDKLVLFFLLLAFLAIFPVAALENRYEWSSVPVWTIIVGYLLTTIGTLGSVWGYGVNKFAEPGVRVQTERGHKVIDSGPYAIVRHPLYVAGFLFAVGIPLALGSFWALIPVAVATLVLVVRTALEDRMLHEELDGYREYAARVRYRLIPRVW